MPFTWLKRQRLPLTVMVATLILMVYLTVAKAQGIVQDRRMMYAIFHYGLASGLIATYALRSAIVWLLAFSATWLAFSVFRADRGASVRGN